MIYGRQFFLIVYWLHFTIFIVSQFKVFNILEGSMTVIYPIIYIFMIFFTKEKKYIVKLVTIIIIQILLSFYFNKYVPNFIIYYLFFFLVNKKIQIKLEDILKTLQNTVIIYFIITLIFNYGLNGKYSIYEIRSLAGKFITNLHRLIGIEGTPAGPDIMIILFLLFTIFWDKKNFFIKFLKIGFSFFVIIWCSSLSNIVALIFSLPIYILKKVRKIMYIYIVVMTIFFHRIISYIYIKSTFKTQTYLNIFTTFRARIWSQIVTNYNYQLNYLERIFGSKKLVEFIHFGNEIYDNPHNTFLLLEIKSGYIFTCVVYFYIIFKISKIKDIKKIIIIVTILVYATTNATILTARGNPIILYILFYLLNNRFKEGQKNEGFSRKYNI